MPHLLHIDAHVHHYPSYPLDVFLHACCCHLPRPAPTDTRVLLFAERPECHFLAALLQDELPLPADFKIAAYDPLGAVKLRHLPTHADTWLVPGRQHVTAERLELCSLLSDAQVPQNMSLQETYDTILAANALPLLDFAPGKWLCARGKLLRRFILSLPPDKPLLFCDTSLRPYGWPFPAILKLARRLRRPILAGSDPLPFASEASMPGTYRVSLPCPPPPDPSSILPYLRELLLSPAFPAATFSGRRSSPPALLSRLRHNARAKKS
ncbi:MAG: hypothetical protein IJT88_10215 [Kiritimatiellae bacterium]|nr:hypothetical protein [Kiritimatiellia bacterium]